VWSCAVAVRIVVVQISNFKVHRHLNAYLNSFAEADGSFRLLRFFHVIRVPPLGDSTESSLLRTTIESDSLTALDLKPVTLCSVIENCGKYIDGDVTGQ
jgi:hypothetical protein